MGRLALIILTGMIISTTFYIMSVNNNQIRALDTTLFLNGVIEARNISNSYALAAVADLNNSKGVPVEEMIEEINSNYRRLNASNLNQNASVRVTAENLLTNPSLQPGEVLLTSIATLSNIGAYKLNLTSTTTVISDNMDIGDYALFIHDFAGKALFTTETVYGDMHVNGTFGIGGSYGETGPMFYGDVSAVSPPNFQGTIDPLSYGGFTGSADFTAQEIDFPTFNITPATHPYMLNLSALGMRYVIFQPNGDVLLSKAHGGRGKSITISAYDMEHKYGGMIYGTGKGGSNSNNAVHVEGTVNGQYTVVSPDKIYVTGNLELNPDPRVDTTSTSVLAIMTHDDLLTDWRYGVHSGTRDSLLVMASIYTGGTFRAGNHAKPSDYGNCTVYGTRIQKTFTEMIDNAHQLWHQQIIYDERLRYLNPPNFEFDAKRVITKWVDSI